MFESRNGKTVKVALKRIELCDAIAAARFLEIEAGEEGGHRWKNLCAVLETALVAFDAVLDAQEATQ